MRNGLDDTISLASQATTTMTFASLPAQVTRKSAKKGFEFNLMIVGESGLGKSTLVSSLFNYDIDIHDKKYTNVEDLLDKKVEIVTNQFDIEDKGVRLKLKVIDCLNYGDALDCRDNYQPIITHINEQFNRYFEDENGVNRNQIIDTRIHCLFYFISPLGFGLKPLDREFLKKVHKKVNIVPIIAKSDALSPKERLSLKRRILNDFAKSDIKIYNIPEPDPDETDLEYKVHCDAIKAAIPFAVCSKEKNRNTGVFEERMYPWGKFEIDNPEHSDFPLLKSMLVMHMSDLKDVTREVHYETYRCDRLSSGLMSHKSSVSCFLNSDARTLSSSISSSSLDDPESQLELELKRKEEELMMLKRKKEDMQRKQQQFSIRTKPLMMDNSSTVSNGSVISNGKSVLKESNKGFQDVQDFTI